MGELLNSWLHPSPEGIWGRDQRPPTVPAPRPPPPSLFLFRWENPEKQPHRAQTPRIFATKAVLRGSTNQGGTFRLPLYLPTLASRSSADTITPPVHCLLKLNTAGGEHDEDCPIACRTNPDRSPLQRADARGDRRCRRKHILCGPPCRARSERARRLPLERSCSMLMPTPT